MNIRTSKANAALVACVFLSMPPVVSYGAESATDFIRREIDSINREDSSTARTKHAKELSDLIKNNARDYIKDSEIDLLADAMQDKDDSVRYWIATSLGFIGASAQRSALRLNERYAIARVITPVKPLPRPYASRSGELALRRPISVATNKPSLI